jgi:anti-sigma factor (TIGR02949 family)
MTCADARKLLNPLSDGELDLLDHENVELHLAGCNNCLRAYESIARLKLAIKDRSLYYRAPARFRERVLSQLSAK